ncbi:SDR family oxidoreductase [Stenotrophomonas sp. STM01]|uniref:SDR family oxidoreductase n=1 Tax=Stenotrophomonas sp. STM01 TaxID=2769278 RepID=UPI0017800EAA|nr:SDR family oxidoreductase [Stenotrophomonas sp. STM01]MBD9534304.1 SDR family oxidoreductase [Stenotrophomonas sp. STM01]
MSVECFVTGGTGFIGQHLIACLSSKGHTVRVLMRRPERLAALREQVDQLGGVATKVFAMAGDLAQENIGLSHADREVLRQSRVVFHLGAHFAWGLSMEHARAVNVEGSRRVALLAAEQDSRLVMFGGFMLKNAGHLQRIGIDIAHPELTNWSAVYRRVGAYEGSKLEAHFSTLGVMSAVGGEMAVIHPATVCGHSRTGHILDGQPLAELIRNLVLGKLTAVPGTADHWLPLVTVDDLVELAAACAFDPAMAGKELLALDGQSPGLRELLTEVATQLGAKPPKHHVPLRLLKLLLGIRPIARYLNASAESLDFIQTVRFNTAEVERFRHKHGIAKPDMRQSLRNTAVFVESNYITGGQGIS